ncbi:MAG: 3-oxoacyl-[acyl-carrier-protein] reductase [Eubacteriales bacterium]
MLTGKTAVITGGSRGIGRAIALELAGQSANIVINYAGNHEMAQKTVAECQELGVKAIALQGNVAVAEDVKKLIATAIETFGAIDILVNNAGITKDGLLMKMSESDFDDVMDINLKGAFLCTKEVTRPMMKQRSGRIINLSSVVGVIGNAGQANYSASKAGLIGFTKSVARELAPRGITVNAIAPGYIQTDMTAALTEEQSNTLLSHIPLGRLGETSDIAKLVGFLASENGAYITGQVLCVDGGMAI